MTTMKCGGSVGVGKSFCKQHSKYWLMQESSMNDKLWEREILMKSICLLVHPGVSLHKMLIITKRKG